MEDEKASQVSQPLLDEPLDSGSESGFGEESIWRRKDGKGTTTRRDDARRLKIIIFALSVAYIPLLVLYLMLLLPQIKSCRPRDSNVRPSGLFPSLASSHAIEYEQRHLPVQLHENPFSGPPRPELDAAWHDLFEDIRIKVTQQDLDYYNLTSIPLADGSGYAAELGVHHELHCLKKIRHWIHRDYYLKNETQDELVEWEAHIDHCIEMMRESIMCRGDPSLTTFKWVAGDPPHLTAVALGHHQCVNWDSVMDWVRDHAVPIFEPGVLKSPDEI